MHLKNFSIFCPDDDGFRLTPAYDLLNLAIVNPDDEEELALTLNGRKKHITQQDFFISAQTMGIDQHIVLRLFKKYERLYPSMLEWIERSFLGQSMKERYKSLLETRLSVIHHS